MSKKVTDLREAVSFEGLVALGVDTTKNESVQVPLQFVKQGADAAIAAAQSATTATQAAATATSNANTATTAANTAAGLATTAAQMGNIEALANAAQNAAENANTATANTNTAIKAALNAATDATTAVGTIDNRIATKLDAPTANATSVAAISSLVGQTSTGASTKVSPLQLRELVGVDHSLLTEQIVPGEFFPALNGVRSQVYTRTIIITGTVAAGSSVSGFVVFPNKKQLTSISGSYTLTNSQYLIGVDYTPTLRKLEIDSPVNSDNVWYNLYSGASTSEAFTIVAVIKYIK